MLRIALLTLLLSLLVLALSFFPVNNTSGHFHTPAELKQFEFLQVHANSLDPELLFATASTCKGCHGFDLNGLASVDAEGNDVNVYDDWVASMMGNSAKDPFWRAKVSHEVLFHPAHQADIETSCTSCHAPMGHYTALAKGATHYTIADMLADTLGLDGVSCNTCHQISQINLGLTFSGHANFDTNRVVYGPYPFPFAPPMNDFVGFEPLYSEHINDAGICAPCHTLVTKPFDLQGQPTGGTFVEQATYHEWLNSQYAEPKGGQTCQSCHMPRINDDIVISANYLFLDPRTPYGLHDLVGANSFMQGILRDYRDTLQLKATEADFEESIAKTLAMLQQQSIDLELELFEETADTVIFRVKLQNKAGHKFPSGYPSRRAFIEFWVVTDSGDTLMHSGRFNAQGELQHHSEPFEPHYQAIRQNSEVQIYEMVVGDVSGAFTTLLERGAMTLKDNRLPPIGFSTNHPVYDTVRIVGAAETDPDFNRNNNFQGTGADRVYYHVHRSNFAGNINVSARVYYQSLPLRWLAPMLAESTPEIDHFRTMYEAADHTPILVASADLNGLPLNEIVGNRSANQQPGVRVFPNPSRNGRVQLDVPPGVQIHEIRIWDSSGRLILHTKGTNQEIILPRQGLYFIQISTNQGVQVERVVK
jgi:hypothetical protein